MPLVAASDESIHTLNTTNIYLFKVNNRNTNEYEMCSIINDYIILSCHARVSE